MPNRPTVPTPLSGILVGDLPLVMGGEPLGTDTMTENRIGYGEECVEKIVEILSGGTTLTVTLPVTQVA